MMMSNPTIKIFTALFVFVFALNAFVVNANPNLPTKSEIDFIPETISIRTAYIQVHHFSPFLNKRERVNLVCTLWFTDASNLTLQVSSSDDDRVEFQLVSDIFALPPHPTKIAYMSLEKPQPKWYWPFPDNNVYVRDAVVIETRTQQAMSTAAYFRYMGFLRESPILMDNFATSSCDGVAVKPVDPQGRDYVTVTLPVLMWAEGHDSPWRILLQNHGLGILNGDVPVNSLANFFLVMVNMASVFQLDEDRYLPGPGYSRYPSSSIGFSGLKGETFFLNVLAFNVVSYAHEFQRAVAAESQNHTKPPLARIDFTKFLMNNDPYKREADGMERIVAHYKTDIEFGRLYLESVFCTMLHKVNDIDKEPSWVSVLAREAGLLPDQDKLYYVDVSELMDIPPNGDINATLYPARVILSTRDGGILKPFGISLFYNDTKQWRTHLPRHSTWGTAKLFAKSASGQDHQLIQHALHTHFAMEPFAIALERHVPIAHFLYRLLKPHFQYTVDVNFKARSILINKGGKFDQFIGTGGGETGGHMKYMIKIYQSWNTDFMNFEKEMSMRGFTIKPDDPNFDLPDYAYAKDAYRLWKILLEYVTGLTDVYYPKDQDIHDDLVLRNYWLVTQSRGFPTVKKTMMPQTRQELNELLASIIFTASVQHTAVNFPGMTHYGYVANAPLATMFPAPLPNQPGEDEPGAMDKYLPDDDGARLAFTTSWGLTRFTVGDERFLFQQDLQPFFNPSFWYDEKTREICRRTNAEFDQMEQDIRLRRSTTYQTKYWWLLPSLVPVSITA